MIGTTFYLIACSFRNRVRQRLRRLRQPRYLIGFVAGLFYLYAMVFRHVLSPGADRPTPRVGGVEALSEALAFIGPLLLWGMVTAAWVLPGSGPAIPFSRAEVQFLFPAPVSRRQLLDYRLIRGQLAPLFGTAVMTILLRPQSAVRGWTFFAGVWLVLVVLRLHLTGVALRRQSITAHGRDGLRRHGLALLAVLFLAAPVVGTIAWDWPRLSELASAFEFVTELRRILSTGAARWALWPFSAIAQLPLASSPEAFLRALPIVLGAIALNYAWVVRGDVAFEEASAAAAERQVDEGGRRPAIRRDIRRTPFALAVNGRPEIAFLWKNLMLCGRFASWRAFVRLAPLVAVLALIIARGGQAGVLHTAAAMCCIVAGIVVIVGPQSLRCDLRQDLEQFALLKSWPVSGAAIVRGQVLAPAAVLSVSVWLLILAAAILTSSPAARVGMPSFVAVQRLPIAAAAALVLPALILTELVLHNGIAVLFPAWVTIGVSRGRGIDVIGQRLLMAAGVAVVLAVAIIPAAALAVPVALAIETGFGYHGTAIVAAAIVMAVVICAEAWFALGYLGRVFDRTDAVEVSAES